MTIRTRLALGIIAIATILLVPLLLSLQSLQRVDDDVSRLKAHGVDRLVAIGRARRTLEEMSRGFPAETLSASAPRRTSATRAPRAPVDTLILLGHADLLQDRNLDSAAFHYREVAHRSASGGDPASAVTTALRHLNAAEREISTDATAIAADAESRTARSRDVAGWSLGAALVLALFVGTWLTLSIGRPVAALKRGMLDVADGKFDAAPPLALNRRDEFGVLAQTFATMTARLAQLEKLKAVWTSVVTHELKTPINVILGNLQLGEAGILGEMTPKQRTAFATMRRNANVLKGRVQRLLDVSQFEAGAAKLELKELDLRSFLDGVEASFDVIGQERRITFGHVRAGDLPQRARWDEDRIGEVLDNLLSNAFKFTAAGGSVELRSESVDTMVRFVVRDTGAGIPADQVPKLFRKFYQADNQQRAAAKGTGLGLAISKEIVEAHGGTIVCESTLGVGTTFTVKVPAEVAPTPTGKPQRTEAPALSA
jgi:signal transduction histidine kinase